jgi:hypothetical protein
MKKRLLCAVLAVLLLTVGLGAVLAGCGNDRAEGGEGRTGNPGGTRSVEALLTQYFEAIERGNVSDILSLYLFSALDSFDLPANIRNDLEALYAQFMPSWLSEAEETVEWLGANISATYEINRTEERDPNTLGMDDTITINEFVRVYVTYNITGSDNYLESWSGDYFEVVRAGNRWYFASNCPSLSVLT